MLLCRGWGREDPTIGIGWALPNGCPRVPQGLGAAPSPLRWPLPCARPLGSGLPGSPAPGPPPRLRFITRRGVSSREAPPGLCGGLCFVVCVCQRARHGPPCPLLRSELRPPPLAGGSLHPKGHGAADGVVQGQGPAPRGSQGTVLWASPPPQSQCGMGWLAPQLGGRTGDHSSPSSGFSPPSPGASPHPGHGTAGDAQTRRRLRINLSALCPQLLRNV